MVTIIDHVALEVEDFDERVRRLEAAGLRVLRHGTRYSTGQRIVMMGDGTGSKLELIEGKPGQDAGAGPAPVFAHLESVEHPLGVCATPARRGRPSHTPAWPERGHRRRRARSA